MRILIEEYQYNVADIKDVLYGIDALENIKGKVSIHYVGYYYNTKLQDCVFILPKVLLHDSNNQNGAELVFGKYTPESILLLNDHNPLSVVELDFLYKFAVWIYRAIVVYKDSRNADTDIVYHTQITEISHGRRHLSNTYLDILLSLIQFNKDNQSFFFTIVRNLHSGFNKINWTRTIGRCQPLLQDDAPLYLNPINKKRQINFEEELVIIFFSILNYISDKFGFPKNICCQFQLITGKRFETYLHGYGLTRLRQIKYKYFSDKALQLWDLCFAFFDESRQISVSTNQKEYLLVKSFNIVFEAIIDELVSDNPLPDNMEKKQEDGKIVDHLFTAKSLIENEDKQTYYIGDSKYYKMGHELTKESVYKQYTYARNVIQWNLDIFNAGEVPSSGVTLRDDVTEGYNIIPNFFISATLDENFSYSENGINRTDRKHSHYDKKHFENRLFDRDTLLLFHYDVNFLFVLSLYARNNFSQKEVWKTQIRQKFRDEIQDWLQQDYEFYAIKAHPDVNGEEYIQNNFKRLNGKLYRPFKDESIYSLALHTDKKYEADNSSLISDLEKYFFIAKCKLGHKPEESLEPVEERGFTAADVDTKDGVLMVMMENYMMKSSSFLDHGKMAIGIKYTKDSMEIVENLQSIGYVLFHQRNENDMHLFAVEGKCEIKEIDEIEEGRYQNIKTASIYVCLKLQTSQDLNTVGLHPNVKSFTPQTRYDAQYTTLAELKKSK